MMLEGETNESVKVLSRKSESKIREDEEFGKKLN